MDVSENSGTCKSSILIGFSNINHLFWCTPMFGNIQIAPKDCPKTSSPLKPPAPAFMSKGKGRTGYPEILPPQVAKLVGDLDVRTIGFFFPRWTLRVERTKQKNSDIHELFLAPWGWE